MAGSGDDVTTDWWAKHRANRGAELGAELGVDQRVAKPGRDLRPRLFPAVQVETWREGRAALASLYGWAVERAHQAIDWYLRDKRWRKRCSQLLRALAIILAAAGGLQPLLAAAGAGSPEWGYVLLALAAASAGFDRFFGLSSGWMRDMVTAQALQQRLEEFQFSWAEESARVANRDTNEGTNGDMTGDMTGDTNGDAPDAGEVERRLALLRSFVTDISALLRSETAEWIEEFRSGMTQLQNQVGHTWPREPASPDPHSGRGRP